jgi:RimJ/RimL family protein N-acetyltransferase
MADREAIFSYRSDPETHQYLSAVPRSVEDIAAFIQKSAAQFNVSGSWYQLAIVDRASQQLIGDIGIHFLDTDPEGRQAEIGYTLHRAFRGQGYATEALTAVIDHLFYSLKKHRITASIDPKNLKSIALVERLGFRKEAHFKEGLFFKGEWVDDAVYALLAKEWKTA